MKVLIISQHFFPRGFGGGPYQAKSLANGLSEEIEVVFLGPKGGEEYLGDDIKYYGMDWDGWINKSKIVLKIKQVLLSEKPDVVHSQFAYPAGVLADKALYFSRTPHVITSHGVDIRPPGENSYLTDRKKQWLVRKTLENVDRHIVASDKMKELGIAAGSSEEKITKIPNIMPEMEEVTEQESKEIVEDLGIQKDYILSLSRLHKIKNIDDLIKAFDRIKEDYEIDLVIAGDGDEEENLKQLAEELGLKERIHFVGRVEGKTKTSVYKEASVFCLASDFEAFPLTILEAMNFEIPIVASDVAGISSAVRNEKEALLFDPRDIEEFSNKLTSILKFDMTEMKQLQKTRFENEFSADTIIKSHISLYNKL